MMARSEVLALALVLAGGAGCRSVSSEEWDALQRIHTALGQAKQDYVVQPGDTIRVVVYRGAQLAPEYNQEITVQPDGLITLINIPEPVSTRGMTVGELQARLNEVYAPLFPQGGGGAKVTAQFLTSTKTQWIPDQIFVTGQVRAPKSIPYRRNLTVMKAIAEAGHWIYAANESRTVLMRFDAEGKTVTREIDLAAITKHEADDLELYPGDIVFVPLSLIARINLWVEFYIRGLIPVNPSILRSFTVL